MQLNLMQHRAMVKRRTPTQEGLSIKAEEPEEVGEVSCLIQEKMGMVSQTSTGATLQYNAVAYLPIDADIQPMKGSHKTDTLVIVSHPTIPVGSQFLVLHVANRGGVSSLAAQHKQAFLRST